MRFIRLIILFASLYSGAALAALDAALLRQLADDYSDVKITAIQKIAQSADPMAQRTLKALADDALAVVDSKTIILEDEQAIDAATGAAVVPMPENPDSIVVNNRVRSALNAALAALNLFNPDRDTRISAARALAQSPDASIAPLLARALQQEKDSEIKEQLSEVLAFANLQNADAAVRLAAVKTLGASSHTNVRNALEAQLSTEPDRKSVV